MIISGFNSRKAAQVVAFFAREQGGTINVLKLVKLIYLADREAMAQFDAPILYDRMVAMAHGPVNSATLDLINGMATDTDDWSEFVGQRRGHDVTLAHDVANSDLDELSRRDLRVLATIWAKFGHMGKYEIRDFTHKNCPEWENPQGSSNPIPYDRIFKFLGKEYPTFLATEVENKQAENLLFGSYTDADEPAMEAV